MKKETSEVKEQPIIRTKLYGFLHPNARRVQTELSTETVTQSEFAKELDINQLVERHIKTNTPFPQQDMDQFADVSDLGTFQASQDAIIRANESWMQLDPKIRRHFNDKVENFLGALSDPSQKDELIRLNVYKKPQEKAAEIPESQGSGGPLPKAKGGAKAPGTPTLD